MAQYDITITGGVVVDGTGAPGRRADVAVAGDRIAAVGAGPFPARRSIDATGRVVAPGFIDLHTHADFTVTGHPGAQTQLAQGVTTLITGNCGQSPFPGRYDVAGFGAEVAAGRPAVNIGLQLGHNALRTAVIGSDDREPGAAELDAMCAAVVEAARQPGVVGFTTGLIYPPGRFAGRDELGALVGAAAACGLLYSTHVRNEADELLPAVEEALDTAERAGARLQISHLKAMGPGNWGKVDDALKLIERAADRGVDVAADVYPYTASSTDLASRLPSWAVDGGTPALLARLADPSQRDRVATELRARFGRDIDPDGVIIAELSPGEFDRYVGWSIADIGRDRGTDAAEAALAALAAHGGGINIVNHAMSETDVRAVLSHPRVAVASDGWVLDITSSGQPHPRSFGTFARVLGRYVREQSVLTVEDAIRKMTSLPASRLRMRDRGVLAAGAVADVAVFDQESVLDTATFAHPRQLARGVTAVLVNGVAAVLDGEITGDRGGRLVDRDGAR